MGDSNRRLVPKNKRNHRIFLGDLDFPSLDHDELLVPAVAIINGIRIVFSPRVFTINTDMFQLNHIPDLKDLGIKDIINIPAILNIDSTV